MSDIKYLNKRLFKGKSYYSLIVTIIRVPTFCFRNRHMLKYWNTAQNASTVGVMAFSVFSMLSYSLLRAKMDRD